MVSALFFLSCRTGVPESEFANFETRPDYEKILPEFRNTWPTKLSMDQSAVISIGYRKTASLGLCSFNADDKKISLALMTTTGVKLLEVENKSGITTTRFAIPELAKKENAGKQLVNDVRIIYFHSDRKYNYCELRKDRLIFGWADRYKNRTELIFGQTNASNPIELMEKKVYFDNDPVSIVYYSDYKIINGKKIPMTIGYLNKKFNYSLVLKTKKSTMIREEIKNLMAEVRCSNENEISAKFAFPPSFTGFSGHFPENPILPGVCQIQCILVSLSKKYEKELRLKSVFRAKFLNTVSPGEEIKVQGKCTILGDIISGKFTITKKSPDKLEYVSRISLECV